MRGVASDLDTLLLFGGHFAACLELCHAYPAQLIMVLQLRHQLLKTIVGPPLYPHALVSVPPCWAFGPQSTPWHAVCKQDGVKNEACQEICIRNPHITCVQIAFENLKLARCQSPDLSHRHPQAAGGPSSSNRTIVILGLGAPRSVRRRLQESVEASHMPLGCFVPCPGMWRQITFREAACIALGRWSALAQCEPKRQRRRPRSRPHCFLP